DPRWIAAPRRGLRFQPAHTVVGILHARRVRRLGRERQIDRDDEDAARRQRAIHRLLGGAVLRVPRAAVQIEHRGKRSRTGRPITARHQHPPGFVAPEVDLADGDLEPRGGIVGSPNECRQTDRAYRGHHLEKIATVKVVVHAALHLKTRQLATVYSLCTMPLGYSRVAMWWSLMSRGTAPKSGIPVPMSTGTRVMISRSMRPSARNR